MDEMRCPACGGLNPANADWCGQCLKRFTPPPPPTPVPRPEVGGIPVDRDPMASTFDVDEGSVSWRCSRCFTRNEITLHACSACGASFADALRGDASWGGAAHSQGIFERLHRGVRMMTLCWRVLMLDKELLLLPFLALVLTAGVALELVHFWLGFLQTHSLYSSMVLRMWLMGGFSVFAYVVGTFTSAGVVAAAMVRLRGGDPDLRIAMGAVARRILPLLGWSLIGATVSLAFHVAQQTIGRGRLGRGIVTVGQVAWANVTFFVIPVALFEPVGPFRALGRSARLFRQRWAETLVGTLGIGFAVFVISLPVVVVAASFAAGNPAVAIGIAAAGLIPLVIVASTLTGIYNAALYHYAVTGHSLVPFSKGDLQGTFYKPSPLGILG